MAIRKDKHAQLFIPGPVEVRPEILDAQAQWMIGHRTQESYDMFARLQNLLRRSFMTGSRVYVTASSGSGLMEGAIRNAVRDDKRVLHCVNGAFSQRWAEISAANGKQVDIVEAEWSQPITPQMVTEALGKKAYDAVTITYNETSTGVLSPLQDIAAAIRAAAPDTLILVDAVSAFLGAPLDVDSWQLDVCLTSSQKAFALPPGLAFAAVSDRTLARAEQIPHRGYYFDFLTLEKYLVKGQTPATPAISLMNAAEQQLKTIFEGEGLQGRFERHAAMAQATRVWADGHGWGLFPEPGAESPTVSTLRKDESLDIRTLNAYLGEKHGMRVAGGYGAIKGITWRIAHMGDTMPEDMQRLFNAIDAYLEG